MKREGRQQHGYVRNYLILPAQVNKNSSSTRGVLNSSSPPFVGGGGGLMSKISASPPTTGAKPWKYAGRRDRIPKNIKGTQKLKSLDVAMNHKLISWRVVDKGLDLSYRGISATDMLVQLNNRDNDYWDVDEQDQDLNNNLNHVYDEDNDDVYNNNIVYDVNNVDNEDLGNELTKLGPMMGPVHLVVNQEEEGESSTSVTTESDDEEEYEDLEDDDDDHMSFCDVGFVVDQLDEEDWCLVEEM